MNTQLKIFVRSVVGLLVKRDYLEIERLGWIAQGSAVELERYINEYGATLVELPAEDDGDIEVKRMNGEREMYNIIVDLHSEEEGRTDLSLILNVLDEGGGTFKVTNFDVDVM